MFYKAIMEYILTILFIVFSLPSLALTHSDLATKAAAQNSYAVIDKHPVYYTELGRRAFTAARSS
ncbi:hypothetical protein BH10PSE19_BH10PSE19_06700 [soil metagenome]